MSRRAVVAAVVELGGIGCLKGQYTLVELAATAGAAHTAAVKAGRNRLMAGREQELGQAHCTAGMKWGFLLAVESNK